MADFISQNSFSNLDSVSCGQVLPSTKTITVQKQGKVTLQWTIVPSKGEIPDWFSLYYQGNNQSSMTLIWNEANGLLDYGKTNFKDSLTVKQPSVNSFEATIDNIEDSMYIILIVVFKNKAGTIVNGPIFSKFRIEGKYIDIFKLLYFNQNRSIMVESQ